MTRNITARLRRDGPGMNTANLNGTAGTSAALVLTGLCRSFGTVHAVRGIDLTIPARQTVALLGQNGAGKSTTIDMVLGLSTPEPYACWGLRPKTRSGVGW